MDAIMPDPATPFGKRLAERLRDERIIWLTTIGADGTPQPNPVWFLWDGESFLIYSKAGAHREEHIRRNPRVALNFNSSAAGGDVAVITGVAREAPEAPPAYDEPKYLAKYQDSISRSFGTAENFARLYPVPLRVTPTKVRGG